MLEKREVLPEASVWRNQQNNMLSDVAMQFAPGAELMVGRSKMQPWSEHNESSCMTELASPPANPTAFWDQTMHSQIESSNLFGMTTSNMDIDFQPSTPTFYSYARETSQGSASTGSSTYSDQEGERMKRRRMLQFTGVNTGGFAHDSPPPYESVIGSPTKTFSSYSCSSSYANSLSSVYSGDDYMLQPSESPGLPSSSWVSGSDVSTSCMLPNIQEPLDKWSSLTSFDNIQSYSASMQIGDLQIPTDSYIPNSFGEIHSPQQWQRQSSPPPQSSFCRQRQSPPQMQFQQPTQCEQTQQRWLQAKAEPGQLHSPLTAFAKPPTPGRRHLGPSRFKTKSMTPIALPFAMLKPSPAQGDVTLSDINKFLMNPPTTLTDGPSPVEEKKPPTPPGAGLSGKSVFACTKIRTEGAGTITILRTKG
ncbi:uncharacterized protein [Physcomitrium patens]|uniref:Uncharacterized protein n=1 Tax=Physcomitrium patens TaxID=3218 RepID=A0A7I4CQA9_PHYPA|nr:uncharacterized protein LOC112275682 isoform X1 [Physcomitrium patens]XP_024362028.1 uncharacterized protein LOC112275682 isoform X1 [Physcomitrium patens]XP_024362029.1 uncharacterized protein LOC112275682 isoform X1 [Physcomitrium patens]|eukprot:XP_024362026.1 uncharacterized protein LOC112275682 isoform X1 [Physcomitrella patens]